MNLSQAQQMDNKYRLDYAVISLISKKQGICDHFIDLFSCKNYKGKRRMCNGRVIIQIPVQQGETSKYIIIDKDHSTRYLVQKIVCYSSSPTNIQPIQSIITFQGYKMQLNKYMIQGTFQHFQMLSYKAYFGFQYIEEEQGKGKQLLFCKIKNSTQNTKFYYQNDLQCIKQAEINEHTTLPTDYFGPSISDSTLQNLNNQYSFLSTIIINYFFQRLMFSYYSQFWYNRSLPLIKIFQSQGVASFFWKQSTSLDFTYFEERFFNLYVETNKNAFQEQELIFFPIFQQGQAHFVLGAIKIDKKGKKILLYELDPLEGRSQSWRNRLQQIVRHNDKLAKQNNIPYCQYRLQRYTSVKSILAPQQLSSSDCGIYVCLYALMIMQRFGLIELEQDVMKMCQQGEKSKLLIRYIRRYLFQSYKNRRIYFLDAFQDKFDISYPSSLPSKAPINKFKHARNPFI